MEKNAHPLNVQKALLVSRYATPLAILLVVLGIIVSNPEGWARDISLFLLCFGILFNLAAGWWMRKKDQVHPAFMGFRLALNLGSNILIVYLLGGYWSPIWMLLALTPMATAIYDSRAKTLGISAGVVFILVLLQALRGMNSPLDWGQVAARGCFIVLMSLMINDLAALARKK
ncbi:MAG: hypothetical protein AAB576_00745 [Elusimicrobiota bacterium]